MVLIRVWQFITFREQEIERCGALQGSVDDATEMVDTAWEILSSCLENSFYKAMLR